MLRQRRAPGGGPGAGTMARRGALPFRVYDTTELAKTQIQPPGHLVGDEVGLWLRAEALRGNSDRQAYWDARRAFLLTQASRY